MILLAATVAVLLVVIVVFAVLNPTARRVALRNVLRRRVDAILVVLGCAFGTAIIVSSLLVGDTLDASLRDRATERLGPVDVVVSSYDIEIAGAARDFLVMDPPKVSDGVLAAVAADATLVAPGEDGEKSTEKVIPSARLIEVYFDWAKEFDKGPSTTGLSGPTPGSGKVALGRDAADALGVGKGDSVEAYAYGQSLKLEVARVLPRTGIAGYATEFEPESLNAFVELGTIDDMMAREGNSGDARDPERLLFVSAKGDVFTGAERTPGLIEQLGDRLDELPGNEVDPVKQDLLTGAAEDGAEFGELFLSLGSFAILAGISLLVNILVMLSEERRRELGILRSMGMSRWGISGSFVLEGSIYALVASALGVALGVGVAHLIVILAADVFSSARPGGVDLRLGVDSSSLLIGFLAGFIVSVFVVAVASVWVGRMTVVEAIRGTSRRSEIHHQRPWVRVLAMVGVAVFLISSVLCITRGYDLGSLISPPLALVCLAVVIRASRKHWILSGVAVASMLWVILAFPLLNLDVDDTILFVIQGLVLTLAAIALIGHHQAQVGAALQRLAGGAGPVLRLALSYPLDRRFRTGATLLAYSLIVFTLVFSLVLSGTFSNQSEELVADEGGGYEVLVSTSSADPVSSKELTAVDGVEDAATLNWTVADFRVGNSGKFQDWAISGFDEKFLSEGTPAIEEFDRDEYPNEAAVWEAVSKDPKLAIADVAFLESGGGPPEDNVSVGDRIEVKAPAEDGTARREVVAISAAGAAFSGVMVSKESLAGIVEDTVGNRHYLAISDGADVEAVAGRLQKEFLVNGLEARSFERVAEEALLRQAQFFDLIEGYLALGLLVGISGLGIVMIRAVRERRRQIGVLRALGLPPSSVRATFLIESAVVAVEGTLVGAVLALITGYQLIVVSSAFGDTNTSLYVPWTQLLLLLAAVLLVSLATTLPSATRAAAIPPATALRTMEEGGV